MFEDCQQVETMQKPANPRPSWSNEETSFRDRVVCSTPPNTFLPAKMRQDAAFAPYRKSHHAGRPGVSERGAFSQLFMLEIPEEILHAILANAVRGHSDLGMLALCCKRWRAFSLLDEPWKKLSVRGWGHRADIIQVPMKKDPELSWKDYYRDRLLSHLPELNYLKTQQQMTASIRSILINWLLAVLDEFKMDDDGGVYPAAHHQTVALFDRYCSTERSTIQTNELQMVGAACAVLALHSGEALEDVESDYFNKASFYTDGACTAQEVQAVAHRIAGCFAGEELPELETACVHIDALLSTMQKNYPSSSTFCLAHYLGELALQSEVPLKYAPQRVGAAAYALSCHTLGWPETLWMPIVRAHAPELSLRELQPCMADLQALLVQALSMLTKRQKKAPLPHVIVKYCRRERQHVAKVIVTPSPWPLVCPHGASRAEGAPPCADCAAEELPGPDPAAHAPQQQQQQQQQQDTAEGAPVEGSGAHAHGSEEGGQSGGAGGAPRAGSTPREVCGGERETTRTPANAPHGGEAGGVAGVVVERCVAGGQGGHGGLQDVSFGAISDNNDSSFLDGEDRRASLGEGLGSVLGAVHEEQGGGVARHEDGEEAWESMGADEDTEMGEVEAGLSDISFECDPDDLDNPVHPGAMVCSG